MRRGQVDCDFVIKEFLSIANDSLSHHMTNCNEGWEAADQTEEHFRNILVLRFFVTKE
jgi:hypothetical protein